MKVRSTAKDEAIINLQKEIQEIENGKITTFIRKKASRWIRRKK